MSLTQDSEKIRHAKGRKEQVKRMKAVIREELTELQRYTLIAYYFEN